MVDGRSTQIGTDAALQRRDGAAPSLLTRVDEIGDAQPSAFVDRHGCRLVWSIYPRGLASPG